jgi:hypothetical protein
MRQQYFPNTKPLREFGGSLLIGKRKTQRPLSSKHTQHLVLKAEDLQAKFPGVSFRKARSKITKTIQDHAEKYHI